ncbi:MAG: ethanolamine ammonia-lyase reactivating factor EutA [Candidatus Faecivicinus sp.]
MSESVLSIGIDIGTSTSQIIFSRLTIGNSSGMFSKADVRILRREVLYASPIRFTPLVDSCTIDLPALKTFVDECYRESGIQRNQVATGAAIITGETARKHNADGVLNALSECAGEFVVATAGADLEGVLAGMGAGICELSRRRSGKFVNLDVGGGTTNAAVFENGEPLDSYALDIGGRLVRLDRSGVATYISSRLAPLLAQEHIPLHTGAPANWSDLQKLCAVLAHTLKKICCGEPLSDAERALYIGHAPKSGCLPDHCSFSGGVAEYVYSDAPVDCFGHLPYGDIGPLLGQCIRREFERHGLSILPAAERIRATVIGAGCHSLRLSGSTVICDGDALPIHSMPVIRVFPHEEDYARLAEFARPALARCDGRRACLWFCGPSSPTYRQILEMARQLAPLADDDGLLTIAVENDFAKALGMAIRRTDAAPRSVICIDRIRLDMGDYIDIARPVADVVPVVIKTLVF